MAYQIGDTVVIQPAVYHHGKDIGGLLAVISAIEAHIYVVIPGYSDNPVKLFSSEIRLVDHEEEPTNCIECETTEDAWS